MKTLINYITESLRINEGGMSGHMAHPIDYSEFTKSDLQDLITNIFSGQIEDITEKIDGTNIQATMNDRGEVVFIRNKSDLNSRQGGMYISDMADKWKDKPSVAETFITAGETIAKVFKKIGKEFFNPDSETRYVVNCECVIEGITNIIPYSSAQVDFHNIWVYTKNANGWQLDHVTKDGLDVLSKASENISNAHITPNVIIQITDKSQEYINRFTKEINQLFKNQDITILEWKKRRFEHYINKNFKWISDDKFGYDMLFDRWINGVKKVNIRDIKKLYPNNVDELMELDKKGYKEIVSKCIEPLDELFLRIGNAAISLCKGLINQDNTERVIKHLVGELKQTVNDIKTQGTADAQEKLIKQLNRLTNIGGENSINAAEGIVFSYKGRLMKLTGTFSPLNSILGSIKFSK